MKKYALAFCFVLLSVCIFAQENQVPAIKIYLEDAENGKNVKDAKVTLEGFGLPDITAEYNKKDKSYYFNEIPLRYNTVMTYHEKYNEKGFQNVEGLPNELKFRLFKPIKVSYGFEFFWFHYFPEKSYVEDPYKLSISLNDNDMNYNSLRAYISKKIKELNLEMELVNPFWEESKIMKYSLTFPNQKEAYPLLSSKNTNVIDHEYVFPLKGGVSSIFPEREYSNTSKDICFIVRKKDGSKFKRFNDPIIKKLKEENFNVSAIVLNKITGYDNARTKLEKRDRFSKKFNLKHDVDSSKVFFYNLYNQKPIRLFFWKRRSRVSIMEPDQFPQLPLFFLISNDNLDIPEYRPNTEGVEFQKIPIQDKALGLGILDQYGYYLNAK
ncbi:hypothetical protein [Flavobacterium humidisoli]|uniref:Uncharacterized protein n=1 Tax=Flavobacterium humidisoli TaxID=2937442 RepID=A0ABY4LML4_9FLAO|nr:hypothetical protein [Flavobacterium humidisoli]UPZ14346.1 hypothetical protein M0M44_16450 [Flavobacterium humidisoli]